MKETCSKIQENYQLYKTLIDKEKLLRSPQIVLLDGSNNKWCISQENVEHDSEEEIIFGAAKQKYDVKYGLRIFIKQFTERPVFYFDSDGPSHDNSDGKTKLIDTKIKTPHINYFDDNGVKKARRNEYIENNEYALQNDINLGMKFFCVESNINKDNHIPDILPEPNVLPLHHKDETDIHKNIDFLNEN